MARDHRKLVAYQKARALALDVYRATAAFPGEERFGLVAQMRRAAVSIGANLVEGSARRGQLDYLRFVDMALGSARELQFHAELAHDLGFLMDNGELAQRSDEVCCLLQGLLQSYVTRPPQASSPKPQASP